LAKIVKKLKKLEIRCCKKFLKIVEQENAITEATAEFSFPRLTSLNLHMLPQLSCFYPERFTLECPHLSHLEVVYCGDFVTFEIHQAHGSTSVNRKALFSEEKVCNESAFLFFSSSICLNLLALLFFHHIR